MIDMIRERQHCSDAPVPLIRTAYLRALVAFVAVLGLVVISPTATSQVAFEGEAGVLEDGTAYLIRIPHDWNGTLINDLDYVTGADSPAKQFLLEQGYGLSGTARHPTRQLNYDPAFEIEKLFTVLDKVSYGFGVPTRVIASGISGGGNVAVGTAEHFGDRIDGAISKCAHEPVGLMNQGLDLFFVLKVLLAPDRYDLWPSNDIELLPVDHSDIVQGWQEVMDAALETPDGRARMALALTISQYPAWVSGVKPDWRDLDALAESVLETVLLTGFNNRIGGQSRVMFERAAPGGLPDFDAGALSWNTGVDYEEFFRNGNAHLKRVVRELYGEAGLDLRRDLDAINAAPRISADPDALEFWRQPGRNVSGKPEVPVLRTHTIGDLAVPHGVVQGYESQIRTSGNQSLFRAAFVDRAGHCNFSVAEEAAMVEVMMHRLDTGRWPSTDAASLNRLADSLDTGTEARFTQYQSDQISPLVQYNRTWSPDDDVNR